MTRDEIRGLLGGYATGTLSDAERKILFEAALEDQELFDELAREQALKEALEDPGAKARLIAALEKAPAGKPWWLRGWVWAASVAACMVVIAGVVLERSSVKVEEVARLEVPQPAEVNPAPAPAVTPKPEDKIAPAGKAAPPAPQRDQPAPVRQTAPEPAAEAVPQKETAQIPQEAPAQAKTQAAAADRLDVTSSPANAAVPAPSPIQGFAANGTVAGTLTAPAPVVVPPAAGTAGGGGGGGGRGRGGGRGGAARALAQPQAAAAPRFAFDYAISPDNVARVTPHANGFLTVYVTGAAGMQRVVQSQAMQAEMPAQVQLPADATMAFLVFSAQPLAGFFGGSIAPGDPLSGTKSDPNPSPNSTLGATINLRR